MTLNLPPAHVTQLLDDVAAMPSRYTTRRLAAVDSIWTTRWPYLLAVTTPSDTGQPVGDPTDAELDILAWYLGYTRRIYTVAAATAMAKLPIDVIDGHNTITVVKHPHGGWAYRRSTWEYGPPLVPAVRDEPLPLLDLLDRIHTHGDGQPTSDWATYRATLPPTSTGATP